jgi:hypothetical protein
MTHDITGEAAEIDTTAAPAVPITALMKIWGGAVLGD